MTREQIVRRLCEAGLAPAGELTPLRGGRG